MAKTEYRSTQKQLDLHRAEQFVAEGEDLLPAAVGPVNEERAARFVADEEDLIITPPEEQ